jgi:uncharacterized protein
VTNYAVLTFVIAAQVIRVLLMRFTDPLVARGVLPAGGALSHSAGDRQIAATSLASREPIRAAD